MPRSRVYEPACQSATRQMGGGVGERTDEHTLSFWNQRRWRKGWIRLGRPTEEGRAEEINEERQLEEYSDNRLKGQRKRKSGGKRSERKDPIMCMSGCIMAPWHPAKADQQS